MSSVEASKTILAGSANYHATDWASVAGGGGLDFRAEAEFRRGIDLELGAEALVSLDASVAKFLTVDLRGQANAAARVRAQVQVPLDLFSEAGLAIRLQAMAEAAAGVELAIGLDAGDFLALAESDPRMKGVGLRLLIALLDEAKINGGVRAKAAAAAMAHASIAFTGRLMSTPGSKAGFTVAAEAGLGLKAGAGFRVFAQLGLDEPGRLVRRCTDILVDEVLDRVGERLTTPVERTLLDELRTPAKIAIRTCYELGAELGRNPNFSPSQAPVVAQRCLEVALEEAQRYLLSQLADMGFTLFQSVLEGMGFAEHAWDTAEPERLALADRLSAAPDDPFEPKPTNQQFWSGAIADSIALAAALGGEQNASAPWVEPLALAWAATQLAFVAVRRVSDSAARAVLLDAGADTVFAPFEGPSLQQAPALIKEHVSRTLRPSQPATEPSLEDLAAYLLRGAVVEALVAHAPAVQPVLGLVGGGAPLDAATTIMRHVGGFVAAGGGGVDPRASLDRILAGLQSYIETRLRTELEPVLRAALADGDRELQYFVDEVLLASLGFTTGTVYEQVRNWTAGSQLGQSTLREACSAVVMNLVGRSLVVTTDVLMDRALEGMGGAMRDASAHVNERNGVVDQLANLVPAVDRSAIHDAVEEIFDIAADVFRPLPADRRARIRELLYQVIETRPAGADEDFQQQLENDLFIPNAEAATALALQLGALIRDNFVALVEQLVQRVGEAILELIAAAVEFIEAQVRIWLRELQGLFEDAVQVLLELAAAIEVLEDEVSAAADRMLDCAQLFLGVLGSPDRRSSMRSRGKEVVREACLGVLADVPGYSSLPSDGRRLVRDALDDTIEALVDNELVEDLGDAVAAISASLEDFIEDASNIDPDDDVAGALVDLLVDRAEDAIRDEFGASIRIPLEFHVRAQFYGPQIDTPFGSYQPRVEIDERFDLGEVRVDVDELVRVVRGWARGLQAVSGVAHDFGSALRELIDLELLLEENEVAAEDTRARRDRADRQKRETVSTRADLRIVHPGAAAAYAGAVPIEVAIRGVARGLLGFEPDEQPRVHVFLNDKPLDLSRFDVHEAVDSPIELRLPAGIRTVGSQSIALRAGAPSEAAVSAIERSAAFARVAHPAVTRKVQARAGQQLRELGARHESRAAATTTPESRPKQRGRTGQLDRGGSAGSVGPVSSGSASGSAPALATQRPALGVTPGRKPRVSITDRLVEAEHPDLVLRSSLEPNELVDGLNTLTVVVTTGKADERVMESVVFHASPVSVAHLPLGPFRPSIGKLPPRLTPDMAELAPALADIAARGGARRAARGPVLSKQNQPARSSRMVPRSHADVKRASEAVTGRVRPRMEAPVARVGQVREHLNRSRDALKVSRESVPPSREGKGKPR